ncbi:MAG: hypothetical protein EZS28_002151 [Streblomastix strix]|uniref:AMP-activated protein kinase glycogen-binding domain-containing protein n=1 Tax=Streblomastix strix TaxID=222440 RepID=A0A5J4X723_9EUKA|nr:MAG: hypothetical protein EZS28_002151 [Streblomastix strix]
MSGEFLTNHLDIAVEFHPTPLRIDFICSFDGWQKHPLFYDLERRRWVICFDNFPTGTYQCKFCIDDQFWVCLDNLKKTTDKDGNVNNVITV